jgi:hypothetical protein
VRRLGGGLGISEKYKKHTLCLHYCSLFFFICVHVFTYRTTEVHSLRKALFIRLADCFHIYLKGQCHQICWSRFFNTHLHPPKPPLHTRRIFLGFEHLRLLIIIYTTVYLASKFIFLGSLYFGTKLN